jgi:hypothetical protein
MLLRIGAYAVALVVIFGAAYFAGAAIDPIIVKPSHGHSES